MRFCQNSCTMGMHIWNAHLGCTSGMHIWNTHQGCTVGMHIWDAQWGCTSWMHIRDAHLGYTVGMYTWDVQQGCVSGMHIRDAHLECTFGMHIWDAQWVCTSEMHSGDVHLGCAAGMDSRDAHHLGCTSGMSAGFGKWWVLGHIWGFRDWSTSGKWSCLSAIIGWLHFSWTINHREDRKGTGELGRELECTINFVVNEVRGSNRSQMGSKELSKKIPFYFLGKYNHYQSFLPPPSLPFSLPSFVPPSLEEHR